MLKKFTAAVLALSLVVGLGAANTQNSLTVNTAYASCGDGVGVCREIVIDNITYTIYDDHAEVKKADEGISGEVVIPATVGGVPVTAICDDAFFGCVSMTKVTVPYGVTTLGKRAFSFCDKLADIDLPETISYIDDNALYGVKWQPEIPDPSQPTYIGTVLYKGNYASGTVVVKEGTTQVALEAFYRNRNITSVIMPDSVTEVGNYAFGLCESLESVTANGLRRAYNGSFYGTPWFDNVTEGSIMIGKVLLSVRNISGEYTVPEGIVQIVEDAFSNKPNLTAVTLPESLEVIGPYAFARCPSLERVTIKSVDCEIYDRERTIYNTEDDEGSYYNGVIEGYAGSTAEEYANKYGRTFVTLPEEPAYIKGDADHSGQIDYIDVAMLTSAISREITIPEGSLNEFDCDGNGQVDYIDLSMLIDHINNVTANPSPEPT